jgi:hypothetical protein
MESNSRQISGRFTALRRLASIVLPTTVAALVVASSGCANSEQGPALPTGALVEQTGNQTFLDFCFARRGALNTILGIDMQESHGYWAGRAHLYVDPQFMPESQGQLNTSAEQPTSVQSLFAQLAAGQLLVVKTGDIPDTTYPCHRPTTFSYSQVGYVDNLVAVGYSSDAVPVVGAVDGPIAPSFVMGQDFWPLSVTN